METDGLLAPPHTALLVPTFVSSVSSTPSCDPLIGHVEHLTPSSRFVPHGKSLPFPSSLLATPPFSHLQKLCLDHRQTAAQFVQSQILPLATLLGSLLCKGSTSSVPPHQRSSLLPSPALPLSLGFKLSRLFSLRPHPHPHPHPTP
ncbi:hypothetical protein AMTR_s00064p00065030 [Amborella trichopoda]|uniref:Uncharacterized protein n=1 Tax=Amborella trichopoda TaxID=13333 RepID=U5DEA0_AMBTC|nr:hypothetical protein AMTR_s00064p00065030 [Amborella trichopoda]